MTKTLIVPGLNGSPDPHWQNWWARTEANAMVVDLPAPRRPVREVWEAALAAAILQHPDSVLVGHSLGAVLITHMMARWPDLRIRAAMLVAPANTQKSDTIKGFGPMVTHPFDTPTLVVASRNDPWMDFAQSAELADQWGAGLIDMGHAGHINAASGFGPWPGGKLIRDSLVEQTATPPVFRRLFGSTIGRARGLPM